MFSSFGGQQKEPPTFSHICKLTSYLIENTPRLKYKDQPVTDIKKQSFSVLRITGNAHVQHVRSTECLLLSRYYIYIQTWLCFKGQMQHLLLRPHYVPPTNPYGPFYNTRFNFPFKMAEPNSQKNENKT
jgi:hypothetical protein